MGRDRTVEHHLGGAGLWMIVSTPFSLFMFLMAWWRMDDVDWGRFSTSPTALLAAGLILTAPPVGYGVMRFRRWAGWTFVGVIGAKLAYLLFRATFMEPLRGARSWFDAPLLLLGYVVLPALWYGALLLLAGFAFHARIFSRAYHAEFLRGRELRVKSSLRSPFFYFPCAVTFGCLGPEILTSTLLDQMRAATDDALTGACTMGL